MMFLISEVTCEPECWTKQQLECTGFFFSFLSLFLPNMPIHAMFHINSFMVSWNGDCVCSARLCWLFIYDEAFVDAHLPSFFASRLSWVGHCFFIVPCTTRLLNKSAGAAYITSGDGEEAGRSFFSWSLGKGPQGTRQRHDPLRPLQIYFLLRVELFLSRDGQRHAKNSFGQWDLPR